MAMKKMGKPPVMGGGGGKPHIRMRKLKAAGGASAFPTAPVAFPAAPGAMGTPDQSLGGPPPGAAGPGGGPGDMGQ
jgi:hypothetical protein